MIDLFFVMKDVRESVRLLTLNKLERNRNESIIAG